MTELQHFFIKLLAVGGVIAIVIVALAVNRAPGPEEQFSVSAEGRVFAVPNIAEINFGVTTQNKSTAETATRENVEKMNNVIAAIKKAGVQEKDIKTTGYNLYPNYDYTKERGRELSGWNLDQKVRVKIRVLDSIGDVISAATKEGANQAGGVSFTIDDKDALKSKARNEAIAKAQVKAEEIARVSGIKLGKIVNVYENEISQPYPIYARAEASGVNGSVVPDIPAGENEVVVNMTVVYKVK